MPDYMLDTDTVSYALRGYGRVSDRILQHRPSELCISAITLAELRYGADRKRSRKLHRLVDTFVETIAVEPFDISPANRFGALAALLSRQGSRIGGFDTLIGAHALSLSLVLITNNTQHFERIPNLRVENWV
jgi:tRNA(fMet)-specific endonuclease VapC